MADDFELVLDLGLPASTSAAALAELRWHLGDGGLPEAFVSGADRFRAAFPLGDPDDPACEWEVDDPPRLLAGRGEAHRIGGRLTAELVGRSGGGFALAARQEVHPELFPSLRAFLVWVSAAAVPSAAETVIGRLRFHEDDDGDPLLVRDGRLRVPEALAEADEEGIA